MLSASLRYFFPMKQKPKAPGGGVTVFYCKDKAKIHCHWGKGRRKIPLFLCEGKKTIVDSESYISAQLEVCFQWGGKD